MAGEGQRRWEKVHLVVRPESASLARKVVSEGCLGGREAATLLAAHREVHLHHQGVDVVRSEVACLRLEVGVIESLRFRKSADREGGGHADLLWSACVVVACVVLHV